MKSFYVMLLLGFFLLPLNEKMMKKMKAHLVLKIIYEKPVKIGKAMNEKEKKFQFYS